MTRQATITEYRPAKVTITAYAYDELSDEAQDEVFSSCLDEHELERLYYEERDEIQTALEFYDGIGGALLNYDSRSDMIVWFDRVDFFEAVEYAGRVDEYSGCDLWCGWDLAQAFNKHAQTLIDLRATVERFERDEQEEHDRTGQSFKCYDVMDAQSAYCQEFDAALEDVARAYHKLVDEAFDYFYCGNGARDIWESARWVYIEDRLYDVNGNDITDLVERYA